MNKFITHKSGKGKLGFPLTETTTIIMGGSGRQASEITTSFETLKLTTGKLDSMLFEIPPGCRHLLLSCWCSSLHIHNNQIYLTGISSLINIQTVRVIFLQQNGHTILSSGREASQKVFL